MLLRVSGKTAERFDERDGGIHRRLAGTAFGPSTACAPVHDDEGDYEEEPNRETHQGEGDDDRPHALANIRVKNARAQNDGQEAQDGETDRADDHGGENALEATC